jgi:gluconate 2-dehydrogenase gamma chain
MEAVAERFIPADRDPGARDAQVIHFLDRQLTRHYRRHQKAYREGLAALDGKARSAHGKTFVELDATAQDALLAAMEKGSGDEKQIFEMWLAHTMQGFYGNPRHGGNRDAVSWRMLGVPPIPVRGRLHYNAAKES